MQSVVYSREAAEQIVAHLREREQVVSVEWRATEVVVTVAQHAPISHAPDAWLVNPRLQDIGPFLVTPYGTLHTPVHTSDQERPNRSGAICLPIGSPNPHGYPDRSSL